MRNIFLLTILATSIGVSAFGDIVDPYSLTSVKDVAVLQLNKNGTYDVVCTNGNRETATDLDLELGNVCPHRTSSEPSGILSIQQIGSNLFSVVCRDFKRVEATAEQIMSGKVCAASEPSVLIEEGAYKVDSGDFSFCNQQLNTDYEGKTLKGIQIKFLSPCGGATSTFLCDGLKCKASAFAPPYVIDILDQTSYRFTNKSGETAIFKKNK